MSKTKTFDARVAFHGSLYVLHPLTDDAQTWIDEHIPSDAMTWAGGVVVEPRYIIDIVDGMVADGFSVQGTFGLSQVGR